MPIRPVNIAILDDHTLFRKTLKKYLSEQKNFRAIEAQDMTDLLNQLKASPIDVLLMDIFMPEFSASDAVLKIRREYPATKILVLSVCTDVELISDLLDSGIHGYVSKSDDPGDLLEAIQAVFDDRICQNRLFIEALYRNKQSAIKDYPNDTRDLLSEREKTILQLLWKEKSNKEIANELFLGIRTVERLRQEMKEKIGVTSTVGLIKFAIQKKIIKINSIQSLRE